MFVKSFIRLVSLTVLPLHTHVLDLSVDSGASLNFIPTCCRIETLLGTNGAHPAFLKEATFCLRSLDS